MVIPDLIVRVGGYELKVKWRIAMRVASSWGHTGIWRVSGGIVVAATGRGIDGDASHLEGM